MRAVALLSLVVALLFGRGELGGLNFGVVKLMYEQNGAFKMKLPSGEVFDFEAIAHKPLNEQIKAWNAMAKSAGLPVEPEHPKRDPAKREKDRLTRVIENANKSVKEVYGELTDERPRGNYVRTKREFEEALHRRIVSQTARQEEQCQKGVVEDCFNVGKLYFIGMTGKGRDFSKAFRFFNEACRLGEGRGCYYMGRLSTNAPVRIHRYEEACEKGYAAACTEVGAIFLQGREVPPDYTRAFAYAMRGCRGYDAMGCDFVSTMYRFGLGRPVDVEKSERYLQKAADIRSEPWKYNALRRGRKGRKK